MARSTLRPTLFALALFLASATGCGSDPFGPGGDPNGDLDVEFRNFSSQPAEMALAGGTPITLVGNLSDGTPRIYKVVNPGLGNTLDFTAQWNGTTLTATCTVSDITGISVPPGVVIQPLGFLDCSGW